MTVACDGRKVCQKCKGNKMVEERVYDRGGRVPHGMPVYSWWVCDMCGGKGFITDADREYKYNQFMAAFR